MLALYVGLPALIALGPRWTVLAAILASGAVCLAALLLDRTFSRRQLAGADGARRGARVVLARAAVVAAALVALGALTRGPASLFLRAFFRVGRDEHDRQIAIGRERSQLSRQLDA